MDDPLKPKTVPLAAETILWFEFLLNPNLLTTHLNKPAADPSAIDLISQFISISPDHNVVQYDITGAEIEQILMPKNDSLKIARKQLALKILTLKVATYLKWNLNIIEKELHIQKQIYLLRDLCTISFGQPVIVPLTNDFDFKITTSGSKKAVCFALTTYHRWVLRIQLLKEIAIKNIKPVMHVIGMPEQINTIAPEIPTKQSVDYLTKICELDEPFYIFTYDTFQALHPNSDTTDQKFDKMVEISATELRAQVHFDLTGFYLFSKQYSQAKENVIECKKNFEKLKLEYSNNKIKDYLYCHINEEELDGYLLACGLSNQAPSLVQRLNESLLNNFKNIVDILKEDNIIRLIPFITRRMVELDIESSLAQGNLKISKSLELQCAGLNAVRLIFEKENICANIDFLEKYKSTEAFNVLIEGIADVLPHCSEMNKNKIKNYLINCILRDVENKNIFKQIAKLNLFSAGELHELKEQTIETAPILPYLAMQVDWKCSSKFSRIEVGSLERQLNSCTNASAVRKLLVKLAATNPSKPLWSVNPSWQIPIPLKSLLMSLPRGFLQDFAYVLLGKAREMAVKKDYIGAVSMLSALKSETQRPDLSNTPPICKLSKLITWEMLYIQILQCLDEWNKKNLDLQSLATKCKQCLSSSQGGDNVTPRIEIVESCAIMLLNLNDWTALLYLDKRLPCLELILAFAATFSEMEKLKGSKKICRDAWDLVLAMFNNTPPKRSSNNRNSPNLIVSSNLYPFLNKIRDPLVFSLVISLLAKIHNILKDDPNFDLNGEYMYLWPANISNSIGYNIKSVAETLNWLLKQGLKYYPYNIFWLKLKGDLELALGNNEAAMRCYVNALITGTEYCTIPLQRPIVDDYIIRKMIKCSSNLGCFMQAAVLCQFLDEIDYSLAFKNISEKTSNFCDAMDAYYSCIWDVTLLEFIINLHHKKSEHTRKLEAIAVISQLELNSNNNEEIKREAAAIRKTRFLRALAKQYLV